MRIFFISFTYSPPYFGGGLNRMIKHLKSLQSRGYQVTVLTSGVPGYPAKEMDEGLQIFRSPSISASKLGRAIRRLIFPLWARYQLTRLKPGIVHIEGLGGLTPIFEYFATFRLTAAAKRIGAASIKQHTLADGEEEMFKVDGFKFRLRLAAWKKFSAVVSVSPALHQAVQQHLPDNSFCIMNGVDTQLFSPLSKLDRDYFRKNLKLNEEDVVFTFLGSIGVRKGFDLIARAFSELSRTHPHWHLWIVGPRSKSENQNIDDDEVSKLVSILQPCEDKVTYWGRVDEQHQMVKILASSDIFVFPTRREGFPNAPLEAMACGLPVIMSRIEGVTDQIIDEGVSGHFIEVGDEEELKQKLILLGSDKDLRLRMSKAARAKVQEEFGWEKYIMDWENLYQMCLTQSKLHIGKDLG